MTSLYISRRIPRLKKKGRKTDGQTTKEEEQTHSIIYLSFPDRNTVGGEGNTQSGYDHESFLKAFHVWPLVPERVEQSSSLRLFSIFHLDFHRERGM